MFCGNAAAFGVADAHLVFGGRSFAGSGGAQRSGRSRPAARRCSNDRPARCRLRGVRRTGFRGIEPVTSGSLMMVDGSNTRFAADGVGPLGIGRRGGSVPSGAGIGRLGVVDGACIFGSVAAGLLDWSLGGISPVGGASGNRNSMAVCATPTTMMATLAAISSVFRSFDYLFAARERCIGAASIAIGGGIVEGIGAGFAAGRGGSRRRPEPARGPAARRRRPWRPS